MVRAFGLLQEVNYRKQHISTVPTLALYVSVRTVFPITDKVYYRYLLKKEGKRPEGLSGTTSFSRKPSGRCVLNPRVLRRYYYRCKIQLYIPSAVINCGFVLFIFATEYS